MALSQVFDNLEPGHFARGVKVAGEGGRSRGRAEVQPLDVERPFEFTGSLGAGRKPAGVVERDPRHAEKEDRGEAEHGEIDV